MIFPLNTFVHSYRQPWEVPHLIHCAMLMIFKFYIQILNYTITPSYRLRFVNGTNFRLRLVIRLVLIYLKRELTTTLAYHLLITSQARDLAKFIMPDLELNVAPCVITSKNIIECPRCIYGSVEDTHHYLLVCGQYTIIRRELLTTVSGICNPTLNVLLYGDPSLSLEQNKYIVKAVQDFILKSKRFQ